jgi:hypothetical protein
MMTRKHFEEIAACLNRLKPSEMRYNYDELTEEQRGKVAQWQRSVHHLAAMCADSNPAFDAARFLAACGATEAAS